MAYAYNPVIGVLAGADMPLKQLRRSVEGAEFIFAADGAANRLREIGVVPTATIGDLDSLKSPENAGLVIHDQGQDDSDCDKLLRLIQSRGFTSVTLVGAEGDRLDHVLGTLFSAVRSGLDVQFILRRAHGWLIRPGSVVTVAAPLGAGASLMPIEPCELVDLSGVEWPLANVRLTPTGQVSLSNRVTGPEVRVEILSGSALLTVLTDGS